MSDPLVEGDRVVYWGMGDYVSPLFTPSVGDTVTVIPLQDGDFICIPKLEFQVGDHAWHAVDFPFAAFDWKLDFDFQLIPLIFSSLWGRLTAVGGDSYPNGLPTNIVEDKTKTLTVDAEIGKYLHMLSGYLKDQYLGILDNGTDWYEPPMYVFDLINGDLSMSPLGYNWSMWNAGYWWETTEKGYAAGGPVGEYAYFGFWDNSGYHSYTSGYIIFNTVEANLVPGTWVSFYYKTENFHPTPYGDGASNVQLFWGGTGAGATYRGYQDLPPVTSWTKVSRQVIDNYGGRNDLTFKIQDGTKLFVAGIHSGSDLTAYGMGFRVGDYYEIVDSPP